MKFKLEIQPTYGGYKVVRIEYIENPKSCTTFLDPLAMFPNKRDAVRWFELVTTRISKELFRKVDTITFNDEYKQYMPVSVTFVSNRLPDIKDFYEQRN